MNQHGGKTIISHWHGYNSEIHGVIDDRLEHFRIVSPLDAHRHVGILLLKMRKDFGKDVQAGAFVRTYNNLTSRYTLSFSDRGCHGLAGVEGIFRELQK